MFNSIVMHMAFNQEMTRKMATLVDVLCDSFNASQKIPSNHHRTEHNFSSPNIPPNIKNVKGIGKAIPVTGRGGP
jgi:hypothetical protein